jgi:acetyltransferase
MEDHLAMGTLVCVGNRLNVEFADVLDFCAEDSETETIALYIEGLEDVRTFYEAARRCASRKPVVVLHAGRTRAGRKTSISHTGSMAASSAIYTGMFCQAGLVEVRSIQELSDTVKAISLASPPAGNRVALITHTAGPAIIATDILEDGGMTIPDLHPDTKAALVDQKIVPPFIPVSNPVDLATAGTDRQAYLDVMNTLETDPNIDSILTVCVSLLGGQDENPLYFPVEAYKEKVNDTGKPSVMVWAAPVTMEEEFLPWERSGIPTYPTPERGAIALINLCRYGTMKHKSSTGDIKAVMPETLNRYVKEFQAKGISFVGEVEAKHWLTLAGINVAESALIGSEDEAVQHAVQSGFPVVMKIVSERIVHKSDAGCVRLALRDVEAVRAAYREIMSNASTVAKPEEILGVTIQPMIPEGFELIVGGLRDSQAGPVVMFGLGGIWVEAMNEVAYRLAPVSREEAEAMILEIRGADLLLHGGRQRHPVNREALLDLIVRTSYLMAELPITELDLNPVIFFDDRYAVADARIFIEIGHNREDEADG